MPSSRARHDECHDSRPQPQTATQVCVQAEGLHLGVARHHVHHPVVRHVRRDGLRAQVEGAVSVHVPLRAQRARGWVVQPAPGGQRHSHRRLRTVSCRLSRRLACIRTAARPGDTARRRAALQATAGQVDAAGRQRQHAAAQQLHRCRRCWSPPSPPPTHRMDSPSSAAACSAGSSARQPSSALSASIWRRCSAVLMLNSPPTCSTGCARAAQRGSVSADGTAARNQQALRQWRRCCCARSPRRRPRHCAASRQSCCPPRCSAAVVPPPCLPLPPHLDARQLEPRLHPHAHLPDDALQAVVLVGGAHRLVHSLTQPGRQVAVVLACTHAAPHRPDLTEKSRVCFRVRRLQGCMQHRRPCTCCLLRCQPVAARQRGLAVGARQRFACCACCHTPVCCHITFARYACCPVPTPAATSHLPAAPAATAHTRTATCPPCTHPGRMLPLPAAAPPG